jgi:hypothetical protein
MPTHQPRAQALFRWWFAVLLFVLLIGVALVSTPSGQALVGPKAVAAADYLYYIYLSLIFKS